MSYLAEHFFIVNFGIRDKDGFETFPTRRECECFIIENKCKTIEKAVNTVYEIHMKHDEYF